MRNALQHKNRNAQRRIGEREKKNEQRALITKNPFYYNKFCVFLARQKRDTEK